MTPELLTIPAREVLTVDGAGAPTDQAFGRAVRALFAVRAALGDTVDVPLEGSYDNFDLAAPEVWTWRLTVPAPEGAGAAEVLAASSRFGAPVVLRKPGPQRVARLLHVGPYDDEGPALEALYAFAGGKRTHTEIYLTDPASTPPAQLRTYLQVEAA